MDDVKDQTTTEVQPQAEETAEQPSQPAEQTSETPDNVEEPQERTVPLQALREERARRQELQRKLAEKESSQAMSQVDPDTYEAWVNNPMSQELIIKVARQELTDYAREILDKHPGLHDQVKKAILKNARGFVNESTTDVETAKVDLLEYIESIADEAGTQLQPSKGFKVANTNVPSTESDKGANSAEIDKIMMKPVNEWTDEDEALMKDYQKNHLK